MFIAVGGASLPRLRRTNKPPKSPLSGGLGKSLAPQGRHVYSCGRGILPRLRRTNNPLNPPCQGDLGSLQPQRGDMFIAVGGASLPRLRRTNNPLNPPCQGDLKKPPSGTTPPPVGGASCPDAKVRSFVPQSVRL